MNIALKTTRRWRLWRRRRVCTHRYHGGVHGIRLRSALPDTRVHLEARSTRRGGPGPRVGSLCQAVFSSEAALAEHEAVVHGPYRALPLSEGRSCALSAALSALRPFADQLVAGSGTPPNPVRLAYVREALATPTRQAADTLWRHLLPELGLQAGAHADFVAVAKALAAGLCGHLGSMRSTLRCVPGCTAPVQETQEDQVFQLVGSLAVELADPGRCLAGRATVVRCTVCDTVICREGTLQTGAAGLAWAALNAEGGARPRSQGSARVVRDPRAAWRRRVRCGGSGGTHSPRAGVRPLAGAGSAAACWPAMVATAGASSIARSSCVPVR